MSNVGIRPGDGTTHLTLEEWDERIGRHLQMIEAGAEICERHASQLMGLPDWEVRALQHIDKAERLLNSAIVLLARTKAEMERKPRVS